MSIKTPLNIPGGKIKIVDNAEWYTPYAFLNDPLQGSIDALISIKNEKLYDTVKERFDNGRKQLFYIRPFTWTEKNDYDHLSNGTRRYTFIRVVPQGEGIQKQFLGELSLLYADAELEGQPVFIGWRPGNNQPVFSEYGGKMVSGRTMSHDLIKAIEAIDPEDRVPRPSKKKHYLLYTLL